MGKRKSASKMKLVNAYIFLQGKEMLEPGRMEDYINPEMCASCYSKATNVLTIDIKTTGGKIIFHANVPICNHHISALNRLKGDKLI